MIPAPRTYLSTTFAADGRPVTEVLREVREEGIDAVELGSTHRHESDLEQRLHDEFGDMALLTHNFFPPPATDDGFVINFSDPDESHRQASIECAARNIAFAAAIGSRLHTLHPGFIAGARASESRAGRNYDFEFAAAPADGARSAFVRMVESLKTLAARAQAFNVPLAVETQGTVTAADKCLFQTLPEVLALIREFDGAFGINCNLGHLALASRVFGFEALAYVDAIAPFIRAFELSHNDGTGDQHLPLRDGAWYWEAIMDPRFADVPMIVELRDVPTRAACDNVRDVESRRPQRHAAAAPAVTGARIS